MTRLERTHKTPLRLQSCIRATIFGKDKLFKRHAARIRRPSAGFCGVWRRHIMRFMFTRGESCPGLPQLFRRRVVDARNNTTTYTYDNMDRLATRKDALLAIESYQYDGNG